MYLEYRRSTGNACRLASVWCRGRVDKSVSRYSSAGHCAHRPYLGSYHKQLFKSSPPRCCMRIAYHISDGGVRDDARCSFGHALSYVTLLADRRLDRSWFRRRLSSVI